LAVRDFLATLPEQHIHLWLHHILSAPDLPAGRRNLCYLINLNAPYMPGWKRWANSLPSCFGPYWKSERYSGSYRWLWFY